MTIPQEVKSIIKKLAAEKFEAYIVGGCVRDIMQGKTPADWDIATNAKPEEIKKIFPDSFYENNFLTVTVLTKSKNPKLKEIEITTFRSEAKYTDKRHPDEIKFAKSLQEDLARRDFTMNAIAIDLKSEARSTKSETNTKYKIQNTKYGFIDPFGGQDDLEKKVIRAVGDPEERFSEDALRMMRAVRFSSTLGFQIEPETFKAIKKNVSSLKFISKERIRDELLKIILSDRPAEGIETLRSLGLLKYIIPEIEEGYRVGQNKHHVFDCYEHSLKALEYAGKQKFNYLVRMASLLHDVGKPRSKRGEGLDSTFYGHEVIGAKMTEKILERLKFPGKDIEKITKLVRYHLFYYNVGEVSESSVRRLVRQMGPENMEELLQVRMADRIGSGVPKAEPYKLRHLKYVIEKASKDPISAKMLKMNGNDLMKILNIEPSPKVGQILDVLLGIVLQDPAKNTKEFLEKEIKRLGKLSEKELINLAKDAKKEREKVETKQDKMTKEKYWVT